MWKNSSWSDFFALHELDVVDEQDVALPVAALEGGGGVGPDGVDELVHEGLGGDVADVPAGEVLPDVVPDGVQEMGLAQPGVAVDEQRVVGPGRHLGHGLGRGVGEAVGRADDEGVEGVADDRDPRHWRRRAEPRLPARPDGRRPVRGRAGFGDRSSSSRSEVSRQRVGDGHWGHVQADLDLLGGATSWHRRGDESQEAVLDPVAHQGARGGEHEEVAVEGLGVRAPGNHVRQVASDTCSRSASAQRFHKSFMSFTRASAVPPPGFVHKQIHRCGLLGSSFPAVGGRDVDGPGEGGRRIRTTLVGERRPVRLARYTAPSGAASG